jgi:hypothetical protein
MRERPQVFKRRRQRFGSGLGQTRAFQHPPADRSRLLVRDEHRSWLRQLTFAERWDADTSHLDGRRLGRQERLSILAGGASGEQARWRRP